MICTLILVLSAFPVRTVSLLGSVRPFTSVMMILVLVGSCLRYADMALFQSSLLINDCNNKQMESNKRDNDKIDQLCKQKADTSMWYCLHGPSELCGRAASTTSRKHHLRSI